MTGAVQPPLPTFLIIGAQKSATRWLRSNLGEHPEIYTPPEELHGFNRRPMRPDAIRRYRVKFSGWQGEPFVGESTPGYMMLRHEPAVVAERIDTTVPDIRLIALLRNPVDRAHSALVHHIARRRLPTDTNLLEFVRANEADTQTLSLVSGGLYAASLEPYIDRFGDRLLVLLHDDLKTDSPGVYRRARTHIGCSTDWLPPSLSEVRFSNQQGEARRLPPKVSAADRQALFEYFADDVQKLERLLDRDLSNWLPERQPPER